MRVAEALSWWSILGTSSEAQRYDILETSPGFLDPGLDWSSPHGQVRLVFHLMFVYKTAHNPVGVIYRWQASQQMNLQTREPEDFCWIGDFEE